MSRISASTDTPLFLGPLAMFQAVFLVLQRAALIFNLTLIVMMFAFIGAVSYALYFEHEILKAYLPQAATLALVFFAIFIALLFKVLNFSTQKTLSAAIASVPVGMILFWALESQWGIISITTSFLYGERIVATMNPFSAIMWWTMSIIAIAAVAIPMGRWNEEAE